MPREFSRKVRVAESIKRALAPLVNDWMRERYDGLASLTTVDVSPDLKRSRIYVSVFGCEDAAEVIEALNGAAGKFRHALGVELRLRALPALEFCRDESIEQGDTISQMLNAIKTGEADG